MTFYEGDGWYQNSLEEICSQFQIKPKELEGINILYANYSLGNYVGDSFILFEKDGKLFEVNASHCSCYGLEGQWEPEETTKEALKLRKDFSEKLKKLVESL